MLAHLTLHSIRHPVHEASLVEVKNFLEMKDAAPNSTDLPRFRGAREVENIKQSFLDNLFYGLGRVPSVATRNDLYFGSRSVEDGAPEIAQT